MLIELALVAVVVMLVVRSMIRSSEKRIADMLTAGASLAQDIRDSEARIMDHCRNLAVRGFEATAAAAGKTTDELIDIMDGESEGFHLHDSMPPAPRTPARSRA